jgi:hypothetical protein
MPDKPVDVVRAHIDQVADAAQAIRDKAAKAAADAVAARDQTPPAGSSAGTGSAHG